jgi:hypothetical protein
MEVTGMASKYEKSPYKEVGLKAEFVLDDRDEILTDKNQHKKKKFKNKPLKGFENF